MDRRTQKTRTAIYNALNNLLAEKKYSNITIQEIIDRANIGRSTFYSHFETKDELLKSMCTDIFEHSNLNSSLEKTDTLQTDNKKLQVMLTHILNHIKDNEKIIKGVFSSESGEIFKNFFKEYFKFQIKDNVLYPTDPNGLVVPEEFVLNHISGSFVETVKWWLENNSKCSPEELTLYFIAVINPMIKFN